MGLGKVRESNTLYLSIAGGFIWNKKADESDPDYATQEYTKADKSTGVRSGAQYADLTGIVKGCQFKSHSQYGDSINVTIDSDGDLFILAVPTNNRYSQDLMRALLKADLELPLFIKPYDFVGQDRKRTMGISFRQNGDKLDLRIDDAPTKDKDWFKQATKKDIKRFFEDLNDWYVERVKTSISVKVSESNEDEETDTTQEAPKKEFKPVEEAPKKITPLKMKKALKEYIAENYEDKELPKLSKDDLVAWYELSLQEEELPFEDEDEGLANAEVSQEDLDSQLDALMP